MLVCDYIIGCACGETEVTEHKLELGERPPAAQLPQDWVDDGGKPVCSACVQKVKDEPAAADIGE